MKAGTLSESGRIRPHLTPLECGIIFGGIPAGAISRKGGLIWGIPAKTHDYGDLDSQLQGIVVKVLGREPESPGTKCLTLLATVTSMNNASFGRGPCAPPCRLTLGRSDLWRVAKPYCRKGAPMSLQCRVIGLVHGAKATHSCALEVWPESHWPGFALREADVFKTYMAWWYM